MPTENVISLVLAVVTFFSFILGETVLFNRQKRFEASMNAKATQLAGLHQKRAEIVGNLHGMLGVVMENCRRMMAIYYNENTPSDDKLLTDAILSFDKAADYFAGNSIWLSEGTCQSVRKFLDAMKNPIGSMISIDSKKGDVVNATKDWFEVLDMFQKEAPSAMKDLEDEFRKILGVIELER